MNHRRRAENALRRVLQPHYHKSDLFELLAIEFERVLRQVESDGRRQGIAETADLVGGWSGPENTPENAALVTAICKRMVGDICERLLEHKR